MNEPYLSQFKQLIRGGAASQDIHDVDGDAGFASANGAADEAFLQREVERVQTHQRSLTPLLEQSVGRARRILDFGCGTGGTTVALALSSLGADEVIGVDANPRVIEAACVRAAGHGLAAPRLRFEHVPVGTPLPFAEGSFDLVTTISVLEFISDADVRDGVVRSLRALVRPGGYLYIATPRARLREYHSKRLFGDFVRQEGMPWASGPLQTARWSEGWRRVPVVPRQVKALTDAVKFLPKPIVEQGSRLALAIGSEWQKILLRRPS